MISFRNYLPALLAATLLFAQQAGAVHALRHALDEQGQHNRQLPQSAACEQCAVYAQLGNALNSIHYAFLATATPAEVLLCSDIAFRSTQPFSAIARGPPTQLQRIT